MTTTVAATATTILAIDLGKYKSVACEYVAATGEVAFRAIDTGRDAVRKLIESAKADVIVFEACALAGWVHDLCGELGVPCRVANTTGEAWKFKHLKRKTDRDDALRLAQLTAMNQLPTVTIPTKAIREQRALIATRQALVARQQPPSRRQRREDADPAELFGTAAASAARREANDRTIPAPPATRLAERQAVSATTTGEVKIRRPGYCCHLTGES